MQKKIPVQQLVLGMHITEFCGSWMDHPFWRKGFVLRTEKDLAAILASQVSEVWIDSSKGLDVETKPVKPAKTHKHAKAPVSETKSPQTDEPVTSPVRDTRPRSTHEEIAYASRICAESKRAVKSMFQEARMGKAIDSQVTLQIVEEITDSVSRNATALISLARLKTADDYTYMHSVAVCALMVALSKQLGLNDEQTKQAAIAGLWHDLGKASIPLEILNKPGKLTDEEFTTIKEHPRAGYDVLIQAGMNDSTVLDVCLHHHEKTDGSGYPEGLKDEQISLFAKMGAVCDVYDAITSDRVYKRGWDPAESLKKMASWAKGHFDNRVFQAFVKSLGIYPVGSLVRLASDNIGVVIAQNQQSLTTPQVKVFFSLKSNLRFPPQVIDLSDKQCTDKIVGREDPDKWKFPDLFSLWSEQ